jgi:hypothetical protein
MGTSPSKTGDRVGQIVIFKFIKSSSQVNFFLNVTYFRQI